MTKRSRIRSSWPRRWLLFLAVLNTVTALGGAWGLVSGVLDLGPVTEPPSVGQPCRRRHRTGSPGGRAQCRAHRRSPCAAAGTPG